MEIVNWRHHSRLKLYAVVWVDPRSSKYATGVDERGGTCPRWDHKLEIPFNTPVDDSCLHIDVVHVESAEGTNQLVLVGSARLPLRDVDLGEPAVNKKLELTPRPSGSPHGNVDVKVAVRETRGYHAPDPYYGPEQKSNFGWKPKGCVPAGVRPGPGPRPTRRWPRAPPPQKTQN
ncbi:hypothetical protein RHGRI_032607 [Rhododendron griersonianum]|uniref:C2 domain-containing protein n=1 Tax=Rhododendron griersonianum TaxID=479676 RepID=A0AAV6IFN1_9ERIC|nr:hypothetical protein RHGRI_032607 [Rhododendron griersonianum]